MAVEDEAKKHFLLQRLEDDQLLFFATEALYDFDIVNSTEFTEMLIQPFWQEEFHDYKRWVLLFLLAEINEL